GGTIYCADENKDHICDVGNEELACVDADNDHICDFGGEEFSQCADEDNDHNCDICGKVLSEYTDTDKNHECDICGKNSRCVDKDEDSFCDICEKYMDAGVKVELEYVDDYAYPNDIYTAFTDEEPENLFDGNNFNKLCIKFGDTIFSEGCDYYTVEFKTADGSEICVAKYDFVTANDESQRDPKSWKLYGSDDGESWTLIDERTDENLTQERNATESFYIYSADEAYSYFKLEIHMVRDEYYVDVNWGEWNNPLFQLSELSLYKAHAHSWADGKCEICRVECEHESITDNVCDICGKSFHTCDFSGEWKYDSEKHWKECSCGDIAEETGHIFADGKCTVCGIAGGYCGAATNEGGEQSVIWTYDETNGTFAVVGSGATADYNTYMDRPWNDISDNVTSLIISEGVTGIGETVFHGFNKIEAVTVPASVETMGYCAFANCNKLASVTFAEDSCLRSLDSNIFHNCSALKQITLPAGVTELEKNTFASCPSLTDIFVDEGNTAYKDIDGVLYNGDGTVLVRYPCGKDDAEFTTPAGVTTIAEYAFWENTKIKAITLSEGVTTIGDYAFWFCGNLEVLNLPGSITEMGDYMLSGCFKLTSIELPETMTKIGDYVFSDSYLTEVNIPGNVTTIGEYAFVGCYNLTTVIISQGVKTIGMEAFAWNGSLMDVTIPDSVTEIGEDAFMDCPQLSVVNVPCNWDTNPLYTFESSVTVNIDDHDWSDGSGICAKESCDAVCDHADQTGKICGICGVVIHTCDFTGEWKYDSEKHWKECSCGDIAEEDAHTLTEDKCYCGYECPHEKYTDGVCDVCGYECAHEWGEGAFTRPTRTEEGCYTYTCSICKDTKIELVERASNYAEFKELLEKVKGYLDENLTDSMMQEVNNVINFFSLDENHRFIKGEEDTVSQMIRQISGFIEVVEEGIADGTAVKADYTHIDETIAEIEEKFADEYLTDERKAKLEQIKSDIEKLKADPDTSAADLEGLERSVYNIFTAAESCFNGYHGGPRYELTEEAKCGKNAVESATCSSCGKVLTREVENSALTHTFTKYEVTEEAKCGVEGKEVAYCDNGCGATDEKAIEALRHSFTKYEVVEAPACGKAGKEVAACDNGCGATDEKEIEALRHSFTKYEVVDAPACGVEGKEVAICDNGCNETDERAIDALKHSFSEYTYNEDATCTADGTKTAACDHNCGATDIVTAEGTMLTHTDADGDYKCDNGCGHEFEKPAPEEPTPDTPDEPTDEVCDHLCHKGGFIGFIWKIVKFFSKLFKINPICECGVAHY
ncbi:MAG: leucine-rich repeat protein, partial [Clostridia bacterium]|nr:leucine-rich repeat protein [Clostridia bacterium]